MSFVFGQGLLAGGGWLSGGVAATYHVMLHAPSPVVMRDSPARDVISCAVIHGRACAWIGCWLVPQLASTATCGCCDACSYRQRVARGCPTGLPVHDCDLPSPSSFNTLARTHTWMHVRQWPEHSLGGHSKFMLPIGRCRVCRPQWSADTCTRTLAHSAGRRTAGGRFKVATSLICG
jgi:hypothetical protein